MLFYPDSGMISRHITELYHRTAGKHIIREFISQLPTDCHRSEVDDVNLGLQHFYGDFDVAHARLVSSGVSKAPRRFRRAR